MAKNSFLFRYFFVLSADMNLSSSVFLKSSPDGSYISVYTLSVRRSRARLWPRSAQCVFGFLHIFSLRLSGTRSPRAHVRNVRWKGGQKECHESLLDPPPHIHTHTYTLAPSCGHHKVSELLLQGLISARLVALCFFNSLVIFSSSEFGSSGLLYSSSSSLSELSFIFSVSESCFFLAVAISAACLFRHLVLLF